MSGRGRYIVSAHPVKKRPIVGDAGIFFRDLLKVPEDLALTEQVRKVIVDGWQP